MNLDPKIPDWVPAQLRDRCLWWTLMGCGLALWRPCTLRRVMRLMLAYHQGESSALVREIEETLSGLGIRMSHIRRILQAIPRNENI